MIKFTTTKQETKLISIIARRAVERAAELGVDYNFRDADMDITACHCNGCPLDLEKLLSAGDADFEHDVFGIRRFIDRSTGKLSHAFNPRCSLSNSQPGGSR